MPQTNVYDREGSQVQAVRARVLAALADVEHGRRDAVEDLRMALCAYVGALRAAGATRDMTLADVRSLIAAPASPDGALTLTPIVRDALAELTLQWCEAEYNRLAGDQPG